MSRLPEPRLTRVYRLEAAVGEPLDVGDVSQGHRRIIPLTGGAFTGPELNGKLLPGASADWQIVLPDGTALGDIRYTLQTDAGALLYVRSRGVRHGTPDVLSEMAPYLDKVTGGRPMLFQRHAYGCLLAAVAVAAAIGLGACSRSTHVSNLNGPGAGTFAKGPGNGGAPPPPPGVPPSCRRPPRPARPACR